MIIIVIMKIKIYDSNNDENYDDCSNEDDNTQEREPLDSVRPCWGGRHLLSLEERNQERLISGHLVSPPYVPGHASGQHLHTAGRQHVIEVSLQHCFGDLKICRFGYV